MRPALERLAVDLEEQALVGPQRRVRDVLPPGAHRVGGRLAGIGQEVGEQVALALLDGAHDLHPQLLLGAEVVDQHPVARAEGRGEPAETEVADAVLGDVVDRGVEQALSWGPCFPLNCSVPCGT